MNSDNRCGRSDSSTTDSSDSASGVVISGRDIGSQSIAEDTPKSSFFCVWFQSRKTHLVAPQIQIRQNVDAQRFEAPPSRLFYHSRMRISPFSRSGRIRAGAALVALTVSVVACDVVDLAKRSAPIFEQMWSVPAQGTSVSIGSILPPGVQIYSTPASTPPDSSAFLLDVSSFGITRILGADCGPCSTLNGTTAPKPAFVLSAGSTQPLPQDVVSGAILGGTLTVSVTNNLTFDPIYVVSGGTPAQQGYMLLVVRSGSLVLGRDSVHGAAAIAPDGISRPFAAGTSMTRTINVQTGNATTNL